jgi:hypothetical protein
MNARRLIAGLAVVALTAPLAMVTLAGSASAGAPCALPSSPDPDGIVRGLDGFDHDDAVGRGIYGLDGVDQEVFGGIVPGDTATYAVKYRNADDVARTIRVNVDGVHLAVFRYKVFLGDINVKAAARNGLVFPNIAPGKSTPKLQVQIKLKQGTTDDVEIHLTSKGVVNGDALECGDTVRGSVFTPD